jgi:octaprenyl-diphosphate synthase
VGYDLAEGKVTLPLIAALREATETDRRRLKSLALRKRWTPAHWNQLRALIERCGGFEYARVRARSIAQEARELLADGARPAGPARGAPEGARARAARRALGRAVDYAIQRDH